MFGSGRIKDLQHECDVLNSNLSDANDRISRLNLELNEARRKIDSLQEDNEILDDQINEIQRQKERADNDHRISLENMARERDALKERRVPGVDHVDRGGMELVCRGYFGTECTVEHCCNALAVAGMFGNTQGTSLYLMLSDNVAFDHLSQVPALLQPKPYPELAEATGLTSLNPKFMFGQCTVKSGVDGGPDEVFFRPAPIANDKGDSCTILVAIDLDDAVTTPDKVTSYITKHSALKGDDQRIAIHTDRCIVFFIDIVETLNQIRQDTFIEGIGLRNSSQITNWRSSSLYKACVRRWEQHYPNLEFIN